MDNILFFMPYTPTERVVIEELGGLPEPAPDLSRYELFVQLGCRACPNALSFKAKGITSLDPAMSRNLVSAGDLKTALDAIDKRTEVIQGTAYANVDACATACPQLGDMIAVVEMVNERFYAGLPLPSAGS